MFDDFKIQVANKICANKILEERNLLQRSASGGWSAAVLTVDLKKNAVTGRETGKITKKAKEI
ncbi:hypothetical protein [Roseibium sp. M-1]